MIARTLVAKGAFNDNEIRRLSRRDNLTGGREVDKEFAPTNEKLFGDERCEGSANDAAHNSDTLSANLEGVELRVIARPLMERPCHFILAQMPNQVAIGIQNAHRRNVKRLQSLLAPRLPKQGSGREYRRLPRVLVVEDRRYTHEEPQRSNAMESDEGHYG